MANIFLNLPMPVGDGAGASVDTSAMGAAKTIVIGGLFKGASVSIQVSTDGVSFATVFTFGAAGKTVIAAAAQFMRVFVRGRSAEPFSATCNMGANDDGALFFGLPLPAGDGAGAPVDVSTLGNFTTFVVSGSFQGAGVAIQVSEDGVDYATCENFSGGGGGAVSKVVVANWMRTFVQGRAGNSNPFTPVVSVGATVDAGGGGGGGGVTIPHIIQTGDGTASLVDAEAAVVIAAGTANGGSADISATASGFAMGEVVSDAAAGDAAILQDSKGGFAGGFAQSADGEALIWSGNAGAAGAEGAFAFGFAQNLGSGTSKARLVAGYQGSFVQGHVITAITQTAGGSYVKAANKGGFASGYARANGTTSIALVGADQGAHANGFCVSAGTGEARVQANGVGSHAGGQAENSGSADANINGQVGGSFAHGYVQASGSGLGFIQSSSPGSFAQGKVNQNSGINGGIGRIDASGPGGFAQGDAEFGTIKAGGAGSFAQGYAYAGSIVAYGYAGFAHGYCRGGDIYSSQKGSVAFGVGYNASIRSTQRGSFAMGYANGANIQASGRGSFAGGYAYNFAISASGSGSFAFGYANAAITASAINAVQFGPGVNALADSLKIGVAGLRLKGTSGAPGAPADGDIWVANTNVYIRTGGVTQNITSLT